MLVKCEALALEAWFHVHTLHRTMQLRVALLFQASAALASNLTWKKKLKHFEDRWRRCSWTTAISRARLTPCSLKRLLVMKGLGRRSHTRSRFLKKLTGKGLLAFASARRMGFLASCVCFANAFNDSAIHHMLCQGRCRCPRRSTTCG